MNETKLPRDFMKALLAQDMEMNASAFDQQRKEILSRLAEAERKEEANRRVAMLTSGACFVILLILVSSVVLGEKFIASESWPNWLITTMALAILLLPLTALLICLLYFFRYRRGFVQLQNEAFQQTLLALPREIKELRERLAELRGQVPASPRQSGNPNQAQQGFTLMEMLVVVAILGILVSLLFPALSSAKSRARTTTCQNNLRQIGAALAMYEGEHHYYPGAGDAGIVLPKQLPWALASTNSWIARINPYVGQSNGVFSCPEYHPPVLPGSIRYDPFGYNAGGSAAVFSHMEKNLGLGYGKNHFVSASALPTPSDMVAVGDLQMVGSVWCNIITANKSPIGSLIPVPARHRGGANMVFADSHLEWAKQTKWIADNAQAKSRWNNDHQSHPETW